jgi:two-component system LytT family response regulator
VSTIRVLIVDDEPPARSKVRRLIEGDPDIEVVGEAGGGEEALRRIRNQRPDLVFLDIQMPGMDGFTVLESLEKEALPDVVFVTAYDEHALKAFDVHAVDYLLKPYSADRFEVALARAKERLAGDGTGASAGVEALLAAVRPDTAWLDRIRVDEKDHSVFVALEDVDWIEADGNYVTLHAGTRRHLVRGSLAGLEARLDPRRFARIHRSWIVNVDRIREVHGWGHGDALLVLEDGTELRMSRRYRERLPELFGKQF